MNKLLVLALLVLGSVMASERAPKKAVELNEEQITEEWKNIKEDMKSPEVQKYLKTPYNPKDPLDTRNGIIGLIRYNTQFNSSEGTAQRYAGVKKDIVRGCSQQ